MNKAQYRTGEKVLLIVESSEDVKVQVCVYRLENKLLTRFEQLYCGENRIDLGVFENGGYGVSVSADNTVSTAFDVADRSTDFPRYGFLSDFSNEDKNNNEDVKFLLKHHINLVQFYDWMYRHHDLIPPEKNFIDPLGRHLNIDTVSVKIAKIHESGMEAMAYGAIYGAEQEYTDLHPEEIMYKNDGTPYILIDFIYMMNYGKDSPWSNHIISEFQKAVVQMNFDGIHMDQYGFPKFAFSKLGDAEGIFAAEKEFTPFINRTRQKMELLPNGKNVKLIFNAVNNWPIEEVAVSKQDCIYIEAWSPFDSYYHLNKIINDARKQSHGKPVIISAYLKPFSDERKCDPIGAENSFCLCNAVISASGGNHLIIGEENGILQDAYYCCYGKLREIFRPTVRRYFDFITRYRDLLYDSELTDVSMHYSGGIIGDIYCEGVPVSSDGRAGTVYIITRKRKGRKIISLINLLDQGDSLWNLAKNNAVKREINLVITTEEADSIYLCSPDNEDISMKSPKTEIIDVFGGKAYRLTIDLTVWSTVVINEKQEEIPC